MVGADPARPLAPSAVGRSGGRSDLIVRICTSLVMAPLAIAAAYVGGWPFALFWGIAAIGIWWEWSGLVVGAARRMVFAPGAAALAGVLALVMIGRPGVALAVFGVGAAAAAALATAGSRLWSAGGIAYAGALLVAPLVLRADAQLGFVVMIFLFAVVWVTDILAYFVGRAIGGPKLAPRISPNKTWSGAIGGATAATLAGVAVAQAASLDQALTIAAVALGLSIVSQVGDLFESLVKRRFGAKDASHIIPGHGGLMDRLDGFLTAALAAAIFGALRGGLDAPARGLLLW